MQKHFDVIPEGEPLVFQITLRKNTTAIDPTSMRLPDPVMAIKRGRSAMVSLSDFVSAATFPIYVNGEAGTAEGWFIRQDQRLQIDMNTRTATVKGETVALSPADAFVQDGDIFVRSGLLEQWFDFEAQVDPQAQFFKIRTNQSWPAQEKQERYLRSRNVYTVKKPEQPFQETPHEVAGIPNVDVSLRQSIRKDAGQDAVKRSFYSIHTQGDLFKHTAESQISGSNEDKLENVRLTFSRESIEPELLGPLKAREYEFNDITTVGVPFTGGLPAERGVRVSNKNQNFTLDTVTQIDGNAPPGWDVELYRGGQYITAIEAEENGRYVFENVPLFLGDNEFRIVKYGLQGEIQEERRTLSVDPETFDKHGLYNVSLSQQNTQTYTNNDATDVDANTLHLAATYEKQLNNTLALQTGVRALQENGDNVAYLHTGAVAVAGRTIFNADAVTTTEGAYTGALTARRKIGEQHNASMTTQYRSEGYSPGSLGTSTTPASFLLGGQLAGTLIGGKMLGLSTYALSSNTSWSEDDSKSFNTSLDLGKTVNRLMFNHNLTYSTSSSPLSSEESLDGTVSVRGQARGMSWRTTTGYGVIPDWELRTFALNLSRYFTQDVQAEAGIEHDVQPGVTTANLAMNIRKERATFSPTVSYDTENNLDLRMNVRFGLSYDAYSSDIVMRGDNLTNKGGVSVFVFLDKDGNNVFSEGDEKLEGAIVESPQNNKFAVTDANGEAYMYDLASNKVTDIRVQEGSSFDINWVAGFEGLSLRPRGGHVTRITFPIHRGAEMDGIAYVRYDNGQQRELRNFSFYLFNMDGKRVRTAQTAPDGYYLFERIPPGDYYLIADAQDAQGNNIIRPLPEKIHVSYEGDILSGKDLFFESSDYDVGFSLAPDMSDWLQANADLLNMPALEKDNTVLLNFGSYNSRLLASVVWLKIKRRAGLLLANAQPLIKPAQGKRSTKTGKFTLRMHLPGASMEQAWDHCRQLAAKKVYCELEVLPRGIAQDAGNAPPRRALLETKLPGIKAPG